MQRRRRWVYFKTELWPAPYKQRWEYVKDKAKDIRNYKPGSQCLENSSDNCPRVWPGRHRICHKLYTDWNLASEFNPTKYCNLCPFSIQELCKQCMFIRTFYPVKKNYTDNIRYPWPILCRVSNFIQQCDRLSKCLNHHNQRLCRNFLTNIIFILLQTYGVLSYILSWSHFLLFCVED